MANAFTSEPFLDGGSLSALRATNIPEGTGYGVERVVEVGEVHRFRQYR